MNVFFFWIRGQARKSGVSSFFICCGLCFTVLLPNECRKTEKAQCLQPAKRLSMKDITSVMEVYTDSLMKLKGVVGVYIGLKDESVPCIKVMIEKDDPALVKNIPASLDGFPVEIEITGRIDPMTP